MGVNYLNPCFKITHNSKERKDLKILSVNYVDYEKDQIDTLSLLLSYNSFVPSFGDRIELFLGRNGFSFMGAFYVAKIKESYLKDFSIECSSIDYTKGFKIKKSRSFNRMSYANILTSIAKENNLKIKLDFKYAGAIETIEQIDESDSALCKRLADELDASFCIKNDTLIFMDRNIKEYKRRSYDIHAKDCIQLEIEKHAQKHYNSLELTYEDAQGNTKIIKVGKGVPIYKMSAMIKDDTQALQKANTRLQALNAKKFKGSLSCVGRVLFAGGILNLHKDNQISSHIITQANHRINVNGWELGLEFESEG